MARDVVQGLLHNTINMDRGRTRKWESFPRLFIGYGNSRLPLHGREIPGQSRLQTSFVEHDWMQRLREATHRLQRVLRNLANFVELRPQRRTFRRVFFRPPEHGADGSENLSELVMQFARHVTQRGLLRGNQFLSQVTALRRKRGELREQAAGGAHQGEAWLRDRHPPRPPT